MLRLNGSERFRLGAAKGAKEGKRRACSWVAGTSMYQKNGARRVARRYKTIRLDTGYSSAGGSTGQEEWARQGTAQMLEGEQQRAQRGTGDKGMLR